MTTAAPAGSLGEYIRSKRKDADLTQGDLAARVGTTQGGISNWESGGFIPSAKALASLARALPDASVDEMLELIERQDTAS
jgi:transcriptional regulator with XRE-family HTH domain